MGTPSSTSRSAEFSDDCQTALRVAEAIFEPVFGISEVDKWRPYNAQLDKNGLWTVYGTLPTRFRGGTRVLDQQARRQSSRGVALDVIIRAGT
jgi:NTF2 fold immunity protein